MLDKIEFALLRADANQEAFENYFKDCISIGAKSICIPPYWVKLAKRNFNHLPFHRIVTVCGYPFGFQKSKTKLFEISDCLEDGSNEIEMTMNISALKTGMISWVKPEIAKASSLCHSTEVFLTVTIETSFLSPEEIITATKICMDGGADSIKTNSGIYNNSTELSIFHLIKSLTQNQCEIKTYSNLEGLGSAIKLIENGVDQITTPHNPLEFVLTI